MTVVDCPYRPGTAEWKAWQRDQLGAELERRGEAAAAGARHDQGGVGASDVEKTAAGLAPGPVRHGSRYGQPLDQIAEPWRSRIVKALETPPPSRRPLQPLECPWCHKRYKREHYHRRHVPACPSYTRIGAPMYESGDYVPTVAPRPWRIVGYGATPQAQARWAEEQRERDRQTMELVDRFGRDVVRALAIKVGSKRYPDVGQALTILQVVEEHGWRPPARR